MKAKKSATKKVYPEPGVDVGRLVHIIDLGSQIDRYSGDEGRPKVEFVWELPNQLHTFNEDKGPQPLIVTRKYGNTLGRGSGMKEAIESMLGHKIDKDFELDTLVGELCLINITLEPVEGDPDLKNVQIQSLSPLTKDLAKKKYPTYNEQFVFDLDNFDQDIFDSLPEWKRDQIAKSPEYANIAAERGPVAKSNGASTSKPGTANSNGASVSPFKKQPAAPPVKTAKAGAGRKGK
jgi:hypothetical protein